MRETSGVFEKKRDLLVFFNRKSVCGGLRLYAQNPIYCYSSDSGKRTNLMLPSAASSPPPGYSAIDQTRVATRVARFNQQRFTPRHSVVCRLLYRQVGISPELEAPNFAINPDTRLEPRLHILQVNMDSSKFPSNPLGMLELLLLLLLVLLPMKDKVPSPPLLLLLLPMLPTCNFFCLWRSLSPPPRSLFASPPRVRRLAVKTPWPRCKPNPSIHDATLGQNAMRIHASRSTLR